MPVVVRNKKTKEYICGGGGVGYTTDLQKARVYSGSGPAKNSNRQKYSGIDPDLEFLKVVLKIDESV